MKGQRQNIQAKTQIKSNAQSALNISKTNAINKFPPNLQLLQPPAQGCLFWVMFDYWCLPLESSFFSTWLLLLLVLRNYKAGKTYNPKIPQSWQLYTIVSPQWKTGMSCLQSCGQGFQPTCGPRVRYDTVLQTPKTWYETGRDRRLGAFGFSGEDICLKSFCQLSSCFFV